MPQYQYGAMTKRLYESLGYLVGKTEHWEQWGRGGQGIRRDLFEFIDYLAISGSRREIVGIQATSAAARSARRRKIYTIAAAQEFLEAGGKIHLVTWKKAPLKSGGKAMRWQHNCEEITLEDIRPSGEAF